jgi:hypothetical protein
MSSASISPPKWASDAYSAGPHPFHSCIPPLSAAPNSVNIDTFLHSVDLYKVQSGGACTSCLWQDLLPNCSNFVHYLSLLSCLITIWHSGFHHTSILTFYPTFSFPAALMVSLILFTMVCIILQLTASAALNISAERKEELVGQALCDVGDPILFRAHTHASCLVSDSYLM